MVYSGEVSWVLEEFYVVTRSQKEEKTRLDRMVIWLDGYIVED